MASSLAIVESKDKALPNFFGVPVFYWQFKTALEKDENFEVVFNADGTPKILMEWVEIFLLAPKGKEVFMEMDGPPFRELILPSLLVSTTAFWQNVKRGDPFYTKREEALMRLTEHKDRK